MADETKNMEGDLGELRFEFFEAGEDDSDKKFTGSVKNLLVLVKDFYGADSAAVYWFNRAKQRFKLLAASEDDKIGEYELRFPLGNDNVSTVCLRKEAGIFNVETDREKELNGHHKGDSQVRSLIAVPLLLNEEVIAVVLCESKTLNFFGKPNVYTLQVFSESISNYIKYYSLNEDFVFEDSVLGKIASGNVKDEGEAFGIVRSVFDRYVGYEKLYLAVRVGNNYVVVRSFSNEPESADGISLESAVEQGSLAYKSAEEKKIIVHEFSGAEDGSYRFFQGETSEDTLWYCCLPVVFDEKCFALVSFDAKSNAHINEKVLSKVYKLLFPVFMLILNIRSGAEMEKSGTKDFFRNKDAFTSRLDEEITKCRLFNENNLYCVYFCVDNRELSKEELGGAGNVEHLLAEFLKERLVGYDIIFRIAENKFALIAGVSSEERVFLEIEKLRKSLSAKIYDIDGKELNFTASFAIKRYDDIGMNGADFLKEIDDLLELAQSEGGNVVKI